jgi:hypothetical protein
MPRYVVALVAVFLGGTVLGSGLATADPAVPDPALVDPAQAVPVQAVDAPLPVTDPFAVASQQSKADPAGALASLLTDNGGLSAVGHAVGLSAPSAVNPLADVSSLMAHNYRMPSGDEASPYVLQTDVPAGPFARVDALKGLHAMLHGSLGRMPGSELGQPLPGTAPPPGTAIPAGIEQFMAPPAEAVAPAAAPPIIVPEG